ncbi:hypothetical protein [Paenibacillus koleovorans]|uniref:hypothetical protein n=1 Tax=Paenibacillus koleovorans TaxID=121608 RepID=UPI0013E2D4BF|nr:hypothetical protein [Paenibacillus koleovorans]
MGSWTFVLQFPIIVTSLTPTIYWDQKDADKGATGTNYVGYAVIVNDAAKGSWFTNP